MNIKLPCALDNSPGQWHFSLVASDKLNHLRELLGSYGSCLVAYSGGVDSVFLARVAHDVLGDKSLAVIADSPSLPRRELAEAVEIAKRFSIPLRVVQTQEFSNAEYLANPSNRCFFCKHELFTELEPIALNEGFAVIAYGENASDVSDFRPGAVAAAQFKVRAPLKEAGLTKAEIRELSTQLGLPTADKPQMACLSSRIPHGEPVSPEKLRMIEEAEYVLRDLGFYDVRVRHHDLPLSNHPAPTRVYAGDSATAVESKIKNQKSKIPCLARIEVGASEIRRLLEGELFVKVAAQLKAIGYAHVTLDLAGYRRGGSDDVIQLAGNRSETAV